MAYAKIEDEKPFTNVFWRIQTVCDVLDRKSHFYIKVM